MINDIFDEHLLRNQLKTATFSVLFSSCTMMCVVSVFSKMPLWSRSCLAGHTHFVHSCYHFFKIYHFAIFLDQLAYILEAQAAFGINLLYVHGICSFELFSLNYHITIFQSKLESHSCEFICFRGNRIEIICFFFQTLRVAFYIWIGMIIGFFPQSTIFLLQQHWS